MQRTKKLEENKIKTRELNKGKKSKRCCHRQFTWLIIALLSNRYRSAIAPMSPQYRYAVILLLLRCHNAITPLLFCCRYAAVAPLSHSCHTAITHWYPSTVALLLSLLLSLRSRTAIAPTSRRCQTATAPAQRGYK